MEGRGGRDDDDVSFSEVGRKMGRDGVKEGGRKEARSRLTDCRVLPGLFFQTSLSLFFFSKKKRGGEEGEEEGWGEEIHVYVPTTPLPFLLLPLSFASRSISYVD